MKQKSMFALLVLSVLALGVLAFPVSAHGDGDNDHMGMPITPFPGMPGGDHMTDYMMDDEAIWINSDVITVMAVKEMPVFHFWYNNDINGSMARFMMAYTMITEFNDTNDDGAFQYNELLYAAPLGAYEWTIQTGEILNDNGDVTEIWLKYTKSGIHVDDEGEEHEMHGMDMMAPIYCNSSDDIDRFENVTLQFWAHIYTNDYVGNITASDGTNALYTIEGGSELKVDIEIGNFPFTNNNTRVAIQTMLRENMAMNHMLQQTHMYRTHERTRNVTGISQMDWTSNYGNESRFEDIMESHMQEIEFVDTTTGNEQGYYRWMNKAIINHVGGETEMVNVTASYNPTGMGLSVFLAYPNFNNGSLVHDPSIGLVEGAGPIVNMSGSFVILTSVAVIAIIGIAAVVIKRR